METKDGYYLASDTVMKKRWISFKHGMKIQIYEESTNICVYKIFLQKPNRRKKQSYEYAVNLKREKPLYIGGEKFCQIQIQDVFLKQKWMEIWWEEQAFWVLGNTWEVSQNGIILQGKGQIREHDFLELGGYRFYILEEKLFFDWEDTIECHGMNLLKTQTERSDYPDYLCRASEREKFGGIHLCLSARKFSDKTRKRTVFIVAFQHRNDWRDDADAKSDWNGRRMVSSCHWRNGDRNCNRDMAVS